MSQLQYITEPVTIQAPRPVNRPWGLLLCLFLPFSGHKIGRELLLRYQDNEERASATLRLRGAGGGCPQISGPRQRASRWLQWPPPGARECARGPPRGKAPSKARYIIRAGPTGPGPLQGRVAQAPPRWGQRQAASGGGRAARQGLCARGRDRAPAAGQCKGGNAAAPSARLALALLRRLCQRQPRAQADRPPPQVARAGSAASRQQALRGVASGSRCARPASRGTFWQRATAATWARRGAP